MSLSPDQAQDRLESIARSARQAAAAHDLDPDDAARNAVANARAVLGYNALDRVAGWDQALEEAASSGSPEGAVVTTPPPRSIMDVIHARATRKADFLYACPGLSEAVRDLINATINFAARHNVGPEAVWFDDARVSRTGVFMINIRI